MGLRIGAAIATAAIAIALIAAFLALRHGPVASVPAHSGVSPTPAAPSTPTAAAKQLPLSCNDVPIDTVVRYIQGGVVSTYSLGAQGHGVSCEFVGAVAINTVTVNIGQGTPAQFSKLRTTSGGGGRTLTTINGLGKSAFSISKNGKPSGVDVLSAQDVIFSVVASNLPLAQDEALVKDLMNLF